MTLLPEDDTSGIKLSDLELFWQAAVENLPVLIVGGGRWGRVWLNVLAAARGHTDRLCWVARTNTKSALGWTLRESGMSGVTITASLDAALASYRPKVTIVASRPRDHMADALAALGAGSDVLVEKPVTCSAEETRVLMQAARDRNRLLGVGCEFALLPALHELRELLSAPSAGGRFSLDWEDPLDEIRHGATKGSHDEITMLDDLLPHAWSIFKALRPDAHLVLNKAYLGEDGDAGALEFHDQQGSQYSLRCRRSGPKRRRQLHVSSAGQSATVDFAQHPSTIAVAGRSRAPSPRTVALSSVLRLEIGAFLALRAGLTRHRPLTELGELANLQAALETARR